MGSLAVPVYHTGAVGELAATVERGSSERRYPSNETDIDVDDAGEFLAS